MKGTLFSTYFGSTVLVGLFSNHYVRIPVCAFQAVLFFENHTNSVSRNACSHFGHTIEQLAFFT